MKQRTKQLQYGKWRVESTCLVLQLLDPQFRYYWFPLQRMLTPKGRQDAISHIGRKVDAFDVSGFATAAEAIFTPTVEQQLRTAPWRQVLRRRIEELREEAPLIQSALPAPRRTKTTAMNVPRHLYSITAVTASGGVSIAPKQFHSLRDAVKFLHDSDLETMDLWNLSLEISRPQVEEEKPPTREWVN